MRDVTDLFTDLTDGTLPAVSYVKPDGAIDGHPASSKWGIFEAFVDNIIQLAKSNPKQWAETAIFVTVDEGGGYYDSGFIQPVDFFGDRPAHPDDRRLAVLRGGHVSHVYGEHVSIREVHRAQLAAQRHADRRAAATTCRTPGQSDDNPYVPRNMPAIGDLFDMFNFDQDDDDDHHDDHHDDDHGHDHH